MGIDSDTAIDGVTTSIFIWDQITWDGAVSNAQLNRTTDQLNLLGIIVQKLVGNELEGYVLNGMSSGGRVLEEMADHVRKTENKKET